MPRSAIIGLAVLAAALAAGSLAAAPAGAWWFWPAALFFLSLAIGALAVMSGLGGGVLFVAVVGGLAPFHLDFVRGLGLLVALSGSLTAAPRLLQGGLASLRLALPLALFSSAGAIAGALAGLSAPEPVLRLALGALILGMCLLMVVSKPKREGEPGPRSGSGFEISGSYLEPGLSTPVYWTARRLPAALPVFLAIGFVAGLFGLGAGWANVPALNLLMGLPLKVSVGTSGLLIGLSSSPAALIYLEKGALLPVIAGPAVLGMMIGSRLGARLLAALPTGRIRWVTLGLLVFSGLNSLKMGLGL